MHIRLLAFHLTIFKKLPLALHKAFIYLSHGPVYKTHQYKKRNKFIQTVTCGFLHTHTPSSLDLPFSLDLSAYDILPTTSAVLHTLLEE